MLKVSRIIVVEFFLWIEAIVRFAPGRIGTAMRRAWFGRRLQQSNNFYIGVGCESLAPQTILLEDLVSIEKNSFFTAEGGAIKVGSHTSFNMNIHINASRIITMFTNSYKSQPFIHNFNEKFTHETA